MEIKPDELITGKFEEQIRKIYEQGDTFEGWLVPLPGVPIKATRGYNPILSYILVDGLMIVSLLGTVGVRYKDRTAYGKDIADLLRQYFNEHLTPTG